MFCPKCGRDGQTPETFCRGCGFHQPDFDKLARAETPAETHWRASVTLSVMTAVVSLALAIVLFATFLPRPDAPFVVLITAGFLIAMFAWQVQVLWRTAKLRRHLPERAEKREPRAGELASGSTERLGEGGQRSASDEFGGKETAKIAVER